MKRIVVCITCDVEAKSRKDIEQLENIVALLGRYKVNATFFIEITHENIDLYLDSNVLSSLKHELGLHIHWGNMKSYTNGLENISLEIMRQELECGLELSKELGFKPISFRGGGLCCTDRSLGLINEYGFKVDSSVAAKLNEKGGWFQGHTKVPYRSWYYPSEQSYDIPAFSHEERQGVLEIPVTRMIPSGREWFPWTLTPASPLFKFIVNEWIMKSRWEQKAVITPIFHSWGEGRLRAEKGKFLLFMERLEEMIKILANKDLKFITLKDLVQIT